jgi:hypothetical protein
VEVMMRLTISGMLFLTAVAAISLAAIQSFPTLISVTFLGCLAFSVLGPVLLYRLEAEADGEKTFTITMIEYGWVYSVGFVLVLVLAMLFRVVFRI